MSFVNILNELSHLQTMIPEEIFKIKELLSNIPLRQTKKEVKKHPYVVSLLKEKRLIEKRNRYLEEQLLKVLLRKQNDKDDCVFQQTVIKEREVIVIPDEPSEPQNITITIKKEKKEENKKVKEVVFEVEVEEVEVEETEEVEVEEGEEETEEVEVEEEETEEVEVEVEVEEEETEEVEVEVEEEETEEVEVEEEETEEVEVEVEEEETEEVEVEEETEEVEVEEEEEEESVYEVTIKGKVYYVMNEIDSIIYDADENGDISLEVGIYKQGKPTFYKK